MARYAAIASGNWNSAATWARVGSSSTFSTSSNSSDLGGTAQFTDTFTAPNTTAQALGFIAYLTSFTQANSTYTVTLQEFDGANWIDKNTGTYTVTGTGIGNDYYRFDITPYTYTTTTANRYRYKIVRSTGSGGLFRVRLRSAGTDWGIFALDNRGAEPVDTDTVLIVASDPGGTDLEVTVNGTRAIGNAGTTTISVEPTTQDQAIIQGGTKTILKWDTTQNSELTIKGIYILISGQLNIGTKTTPYPSAYVAKMIWNQNGTTGNYGLYSEGRNNPNIVLNGTTPTAYAVDYVSGSGTTASPMITSGDLGAVNDEIAIAATGNFAHTEYKFIKTKNSATSYVLSDTAGGAESGLAQTHSTNAKVCNLQRNVIVTTTNTSHAWFFYLQATTTSHDYYFKNTRFEYSGSSGVGKSGVSIGFSTGQANAQLSTFSGNVGYAQLFNTLQWYGIPTPTGATYDDNIFCKVSVSNTHAVTMVDVANKNCNRWYFLDQRAAGLLCQRNTSITFNDFYFSGCNTTAISNQGGLHFNGTQAEVTFNNVKIIACRISSLTLLTNTTFNVRFVNSAFGLGLSNAIDVNAVSNQYYNQITFDNCTFGSATIISNYLTQLNGTEFRFNKFQATTNEHRWYTPQGQARSSGAGLTETTVRTAGSLGLAFLPESNTDGFSWTTKIPASPTTNVFINGYVQRNATFSSGTVKVELFLPGTSLTGTPDATYTFPTTTGSWLPFNISAYYLGSIPLFATVKFTAVTATAGAEIFIDDLYDAGTNNKLAGLDVWEDGKPSPVLAATDVSAIPAQVWAYPDSGTATNTMGQRQVDAADDAELAAIK